MHWGEIFFAWQMGRRERKGRGRSSPEPASDVDFRRTRGVSSCMVSRGSVAEENGYARNKVLCYGLLVV